jgi:hypothetical protein
MQQTSLPLSRNVKKTRKAEFLEQMERVVPWAELVALIAPYHPEGKNGRAPFPLETMLRTHFLQPWFTLSDPAIEEALFDVRLYREFAQATVRICESALSRFKEEHGPTCHAVCVVECVDGARQTAGGAGMSARESWGQAFQGLKGSPMRSEKQRPFERFRVEFLNWKLLTRYVTRVGVIQTIRKSSFTSTCFSESR